MKLLLGGWQLNSLLTFYSGTPFTVFAGSNTSGTLENVDRAEVISDPFQNVPPRDKATQTVYWFNPAAFALPAQGTYSNQPRNEFYGPPVYQVDFSVLKNTKITERVTIQLRLEIFNIFNTLDLAPPVNPLISSRLITSSNTVGGGLGLITSTLGTAIGAPGIGTGEPRNVQLGLKIIF